MICKGRIGWPEVAIGAMVGVRRQIKHRMRGDLHRWGENGIGPWDRDVESACAEKFVARMTGLYHFDGEDGATDVGPHQVRQTSLPDGRLILHPDDKDHEAFILVVGRAPVYEMIGWCFGREGKLPEYWDDNAKTPAFFVPRAFPPMRAMETLPGAANNEAIIQEMMRFAREVLN